ncbi:phage tail tape measure protein [Phreatobacter stygius]|uniref:Phage tail tape measure protein n=1 Tax=Phreatobacter stygius TaxID=1940610 RepID=A0A4D7BCB7_9HYPH|nr:phage tail tape measure protein [Phreatobacter stygius]QCI65627.1 phage tail tape measure protein [Phreatobacter stygius]
MRVELILEAIDKATRVINNVRAAARGASSADQAAATRDAARTAKAQRASQRVIERAVDRTTAATVEGLAASRDATVQANVQAAAQTSASRAIERTSSATSAQATATRRATAEVQAQAEAVTAASRSVARQRNMMGGFRPTSSIPAAPPPTSPPRAAAPGRLGQIAQNYNSAPVQEAIARGRERAGQRQAEAQSNLIGAAGTAAAVAAPIAKAVSQFNTYEDVLTDVGLKAELAGSRLQQLGARIRAQARGLNMSSVDLLKAMDVMVSGALDVRMAEETLPAIARAALATKASIADLSDTVVTLINNAKVAPADIQKALDIMTQSGKDGQFELRQMAQYMPRLLSLYARLGQTGVGAVADISAALQVIQGQTKNAETTTAGLRDVINKITSDRAVKAFEAIGIDIKAVMQAAQAAGRPIDAIVENMRKLTNGDLSRIPEVFGDVQAQAAIGALMAKWAEFEEIRRKALGAQDTVVRDFAIRLGLGVEQVRAVTVAFSELGVSIGQIFAPVTAAKAQQVIELVWAIRSWAEANPELTRTLGSAAIAVTTFLVVMAALGVVSAVVSRGLFTLLWALGPIARVLWFILAPARLVIGLFAGLASGMAGGIAAAGGWAAALALLGGRIAALGLWVLRLAGWLTGITPAFRMIAAAGPWVLSGLMLAARGFLMLGAAIMATPVGWILAGIVAIAAGAYLIYRNWDRIGPMLAGAWASMLSGLQSAWSGVVGWISSVLAQLGAVIKAGLTDVFVNAPVAIAQAAMSGLQSVWSGLTGIVSSAIEAAKGAAVSAWSGLTGALSSAASTVWAALPPLNWSTLMTVLNWASWILPIRWLELIPGFEWSNIIPTIDWRSWFNFSWRDVLPAWNWSDIVPKMPNWRAWFSGAGGEAAAAAQSVQAAVNGAAPAGNPTAATTAGIQEATAAAQTLQQALTSVATVGAKAAEVQAMVQAIPTAAQAAVTAAGSTLSAANFHSHGVAMMETLATGIRAGAGSAVAAARQTVQQIRDHLPHSPAKTGPLSDLDRVQFGQTLAGAIDAGSPRAIMAARAMAAGLAAAIPATVAAPAMAGSTAPTFAQAPAEAGRAGQSQAGGSTGPISVSLTLSPNFAGSSSADFVAQLRAALPSIGHELAEAIRSEMSRRERTEH